MSELENPNGHVPGDDAHERWLAMQSAYAEYLRVSEVFESSRESTRDSADPGRSDLTLLGSRRDAFERYLEARLEYLERRYDEGYRRETGGPRTVSRLVSPKWPAIPVLVVGILSVMLFSFVREQKHLRDLDSARDQFRASLSNTREELLSLAKRLDTRESIERSAVREVENTTQPPAPTPQLRSRRLPGRNMKTNTRSVAARGDRSRRRTERPPQRMAGVRF